MRQYFSITKRPVFIAGLMHFEYKVYYKDDGIVCDVTTHELWALVRHFSMRQENLAESFGIDCSIVSARDL